MTVNPMRPTIVELNGPGPFQTPPLIGMPQLMPAAKQAPARLSLTVEPGKELRVPLTPEQAQALWKALDPLFR